MSVRQRGGRWVAEVYDPATKKKAHVGSAKTERAARRLERDELTRREKTAAGATLGFDLCDVFAERWPSDYPRPNEATNHVNRERVKKFAADFAGRPLSSVQRAEARRWANANASRLPAVRAMFNDAVEDGLCAANPFAALGLKEKTGRRDITVLSRAEVDTLAAIALEEHGPEFGREFAAMIMWAAYTCLRCGESFASRYSRLQGDTYDVGAQFHSKLRRETDPKHGSSGLIYVPDPARHAVLEKPRRLGDDLMFRTKRGKQFRQGSLHHAWVPVRAAFLATLPSNHHLHQRLLVDPDDKLDFYELRHFGASHMLNELELEPWVIAEQLRHSDGGTLVVKLYGHPSRRRAIERIRRAHGGNVRELADGSGASRGQVVDGGRS